MEHPASPLRIDAHQHFWNYSAKDYGWIDSSMDILRHDFLPEHLYPLLQAQHIDGCIAVQARQSEEETAFLLQLAAGNPWIRGVVGWLDLRSPHVEAHLEAWSDLPVFKGCRHLVQDEPSPADFLEDPRFNQGVESLLHSERVYEVLIHAKDLMAATRFCGRHDSSRLVLDHMGKPNVGQESATVWGRRLKPLASLEHVHCKLSGLITEAQWGQWTVEALRPYLDVALNLFGPQRLMFGSDWPVCLLSGEYQQVADLVRAATDSLTEAEQQAVWGGTACRVYAL